VPAGTTVEDGLTVHRFPIDPHDKARHDEALRDINESYRSRRAPAAAAEHEYLRHSIHSAALLETLSRRHREFDAIVVGPYLFGLTHDVAAAFPEKTLLLPCLHEEPLSRLDAWIETYTRVAGILYHSPEEQDYAQTVLGLNHPRATEIGTWLPAPNRGMSTANPAGSAPREIVYCGRYSAQKNVPLLLDYAERYHRRHPGRFRFTFIGTGEVRIPEIAWTRDLGRLAEEAKQAALAGAAALVQLSTQESLSLVALEAWAAKAPVIVHEACAVLRGQVRRSGGGVCVADFEQFAATLDDLWHNAEAWRERGRRGRAYVEQHYLSEDRFRQRLLHAIDSIPRPLGAVMRERGLQRAAERSVPSWRERFAAVAEELLDRETPPAVWDIVVESRMPHVHVAPGTRNALVPVRLVNRGTLPALADGPARALLLAKVGGQVADLPEPANHSETCRAPLARTLRPGEAHTAMATVAVPAQAGDYRVMLNVVSDVLSSDHQLESFIPLTVGGEAGAAALGCTGPLLDAAQEALAQAQRLGRLPDDYVDVTEGRFARVKRWLKRKLLGNFKKGYVDVLSRQQTQVNGQLVAAVQELTASCAALDHLVRQLQARIDMLEGNVPTPRCDDPGRSLEEARSSRVG
jgi:glycosyltransferase involved in cell wall biosynthesis